MTVAFVPTEADLAQFRDVGYFMAEGVFSPAECDATIEHTELPWHQDNGYTPLIVWLDEPVRQRDIDLLSILANYDQR